jgi:hypothetical protein
MLRPKVMGRRHDWNARDRKRSSNDSGNRRCKYCVVRPACFRAFCKWSLNLCMRPEMNFARSTVLQKIMHRTWKGPCQGAPIHRWSI